MPSAPLAPPSRLIASLRQAGASGPLARKLLVAPTINWARELLRQLARRDGGWIGWEAVTLRGLADELALISLSESGRRPGSDVAIGALIGEALDLAIEARELSPRTRDLALSPGFRRAVADAVLELRFAGIEPRELIALTTPTEPARDLATVLTRYTTLLDGSPFTDAAGVFRAALDAFDAEAPVVLDGLVILAPELNDRGLPGRLLRRLRERGASELAVEEERATAARDLFVAATPADEVREVFRRIAAEGLRFDEVELVATDPDGYGIALDGLCRSLGVSATMLQGLPLSRSRAGRALARWLSWLEEGLPADLLREMLEGGDLDLTRLGVTTDTASLVRALRGLRIGWGRARYEAALDALGTPAWASSSRADPEDADGESSEARVARRRRTGDDLRAVLTALLALAPAAGERGEATEPALPISELAAAALRCLVLVPDEGQTTARLHNRLTEIAAVEGPAHRLSAALAGLREALDDFRAWGATSGSTQPWSSRGGALHLTDLAHAGLTGRPRCFVLGLDAERTAGPRLPDPFLPDRLRERLGTERIASSTARRQEYRAAVAGAIAGLRGRVTLSYAAAADLAGHETGPAPVLLDEARHLLGEPDLSYGELRRRLGAPACAVPSGAGHPIDGRDHWLGALAAGAILLDGTEAVLTAWPALQSGVRALAVLDGTAIGPQLGLVPAAAGRHDPTRSETGISPSSLEQLARCPLAWFYHYVLTLTPPEDPEYDPTRWLDARQRGAVLHAIYEAFVSRFRMAQQAILGDAAREALLAIVQERLAECAVLVPPPSETVRLAETREIVAAALSFLAMEQESLRGAAPPVWAETEFRIDPRAVRFPLPDGSGFAVRGIIDRIDRLSDGRLVVLDYKTGNPSYYREEAKRGVFRGGRHLQPALYASAAAAMRQAEVARFEYRFPTLRGQNDRAVYQAALLARAPAIIQELLGAVREGAFVPTTDAEDCRLCDYRENCRVRLIDRGTRVEIESPRAAWAKANVEAHPALIAMQRRRSDG